MSCRNCANYKPKYGKIIIVEPHLKSWYEYLLDEHTIRM